MKVIDLLNKIANKEELPKSFKYKDKYFSYRDNDYWCNDIGGWFSVEVLGIDNLNDEVEVIKEEKEIEKIMHIDTRETRECIIKFQCKINELIDEINRLKRNINDSNV